MYGDFCNVPHGYKFTEDPQGSAGSVAGQTSAGPRRAECGHDGGADGGAGGEVGGGWHRVGHTHWECGRSELVKFAHVHIFCYYLIVPWHTQDNVLLTRARQHIPTNIMLQQS